LKARKLFITALSAALVFSFSGCGAGQEVENTEVQSAHMDSETKEDEENSARSQSVQNNSTDTSQNIKNKVLIAYFSRWGNTQYPDGMDASTSASIVIDGNTYGTTEYVARTIQEIAGGDLHLIQTQETYPVDFDELREQNHDEMDRGYLPSLAENDLDISQYDTVFIGYPVWATDAPQAVLSFLEENDLSGKMVIPFCTHDGYGAGVSYETIEGASHAEKMLDGLAILAEDVPMSHDVVSEWLETIGITEKNGTKENNEIAIKVTVGDTVLDGVIYDTALACEIKEKFPITVSMSGYGGREYYGGIGFTPENTDGGQMYFDNGDITYCSTNNTMAIFYAQTDHPNLTMEVIPIGKVTSDLSVFDTFDGQEEITFSLVE
jgi:flavodoxin